MAQSRIESSLQRLGSLRDAFIVVGGSIYACGFVAWGVVSWVNFGFGLTEVTYAQLFVAGIIPFLCVCFGCYTAVKFPKLIREFESKVDDQYKHSVGLAVLVLCFAINVMIFLLKDVLESQIHSFFAASILFMSWVVMFVCFRLMHPYDFKEDQQKRWLKIEILFRSVHSFAQFSFLIGSIMVYVFFMFFLVMSYLVLIERFPQGLGGIGPRCVFFDLIKENVSEETAATLFGGKQAAIQDQKIIRTRNLNLLFSGTREYIVKYENKTYEIAKDSVSIVAQCD